MQRGQDERAELRHIGDVAEDLAFLGIRVHAAVELVVRRRGDDEPRVIEVGRAVRVGCDARDVRARTGQPVDLLLRHRALADDETRASGQVEAGDVVVGHSDTDRVHARARAVEADRELEPLDAQRNEE